MGPLVRRLLSVALAAPLVAGCAGGASPATSPSPVPSAAASQPAVYGYIVSSELAVGENRVLFTLIDPNSNAPIAAPERTSSVAFYHGAEAVGAPVVQADGTFLWAIEGTRGLYVTHATFDVAGEWTALFTTGLPGEPPDTVALRFDVHEKRITLGPGDPAPPLHTPTLDDVGGEIARLATDQHPDLSFYRTSLDAALADHQPIVLAFATPAFCTSAQCGPTLDRVKAVANGTTGVTFINVEPYKLEFRDGRLQPLRASDGAFLTVESADAFHLVTEPYIFVIGRDGIISDAFEGVISEDELRAAIATVR